jgi:hypothetical protein
MSTHRVFYENKRLSTAVVTKKGFLQVYPTKQSFESEEAWKKHWYAEITKNIRFEEQKPLPKPVVTPVEDMTRDELVRLLLALKVSGAVKLPASPPPAPKPSPVAAKTATSSKGSVKSSATPKLAPAPTPVSPADLKWSFKQEKRKHTFPAGKYYIGDLCYALNEDIYDKVFGGQGYDEGLYSSDLGSFMMYGTGGDGEFKGSDGHAYPVDAGHIGIASLACCNSEKDIYGGKVFTFEKPVECSFNDEAFTFYSADFYLRISNHGDYENEYEEEGDCLTEEE